MMLNGKRRSYLRAKANTMDPIVHIGKEQLTEGVVKEMDKALDDHELVKGRVLDNSLVEVREVAEELADKCEAEIVQVIGSVFILFRRNEEDPIYILP